MFNHVEEFPSARPGYVLKVGGIAALLVSSAIGGYILLNPAPVEPSGEVVDIRLYTPPSPAVDANATGLILASATVPSPASHSLLVLTPVKIHNTGNKPYSIFDINASVRLGNSEYRSADVSPEDFQKVFHYYPELASFQQPPLLRHAVVQPQATLTGLLVFNYPLTEAEWNQRETFQVKVSFERGKDIVLSGTDRPQSLSQLDAVAQ